MKYVERNSLGSGQAMCLTCGAPYYLTTYPRYPEVIPPQICMSAEFLEVFREHWKETGRRVMLGGIEDDYPGNGTTR